MSLERFVYSQVKNWPWAKDALRTLYQGAMFPWLGPKIHCTREIAVRPGFFFGFHDKTPWCPENKRVLAHRIIGSFDPAKGQLEVGFFEDESLSNYNSLDRTVAWSKQQGAQLQWCGLDGDVIYNVRRPSGEAGALRVTSAGDLKFEFGHPVGAVDPHGKFGCVIEFGSFGIGMDGYGFGSWAADAYRARREGDPTVGLTEINLDTGSLVPHFTLTAIAEYAGWKLERPWHYFLSHPVYSPSGRSLAFFVRRSAKGQRVQTRLCVFDKISGELVALPGGLMASHYCWLDGEHILAFLETQHGVDKFQVLSISGLLSADVDGVPETDGHPQFAGGPGLLLLDTYPDKRRRQALRVYKCTGHWEFELLEEMTFYSPMRFRNEDRVDLHPRWDRHGRSICVDASFNGQRSLAVLTPSEAQ